MKNTVHHRLFCLLALLMALRMGASLALGQQAGHRDEEEPASSRAAVAEPGRISVPDVMVRDQNNRQIHFYSDLIKGKTVAINFIFTTCTTICPPMTANFARVQKIIQAQGRKDFSLISVSVDPENDTPEKLKAYAEMFHAKPGWTFVTGTRAELQPIWKAFNVFGGGAKEDHAPTVVIGNDSRQTWTYASGLSSATRLAGVIAAVLNDKSTHKAAANGN
jgi:protein SCO1